MNEFVYSSILIATIPYNKNQFSRGNVMGCLAILWTKDKPFSHALVMRRKIHKPRWYRRIDKENRDDDRDHQNEMIYGDVQLSLNSEFMEVNDINGKSLHFLIYQNYPLNLVALPQLKT